METFVSLMAGVVANAGGGGITFEGDNTEVVPIGAGTTSVALPGGLLENDIVLVLRVADNTLSGETITGYTNRFNNGTGSAPGLHLDYKFMGASPDTTVGIPEDGVRARAVAVQVFRGVNTSTPFDFTTTSNTGGSGDPDSPSGTTVTDGAMFLSIGGLDDDVVTSVTAPSGYSDLSWISTGAGSGLSATCMIASKLIPTAGAEDPGAFTTDQSDDWIAISEALRPA